MKATEIFAILTIVLREQCRGHHLTATNNWSIMNAHNTGKRRVCLCSVIFDYGQNRKEEFAKRMSWAGQGSHLPCWMHTANRCLLSLRDIHEGHSH